MLRNCGIGWFIQTSVGSPSGISANGDGNRVRRLLRIMVVVSPSMRPNRPQAREQVGAADGGMAGGGQFSGGREDSQAAVVAARQPAGRQKWISLRLSSLAIDCMTLAGKSRWRIRERQPADCRRIGRLVNTSSQSDSSSAFVDSSSQNGLSRRESSPNDKCACGDAVIPEFWRWIRQRLGCLFRRLVLWTKSAVSLDYNHSRCNRLEWRQVACDD